MPNGFPEFTMTPYIGSRVRLDTPEVVLQEPPMAVVKRADEMARPGTTRNARLLPDIGWQLKPYQADAGNSAERQSAQSGIMRPIADGGTLGTSSYLSPISTWAQSADPGATYGADSAASGDDHFQLAIPADQNIAAGDLSSDRAAYPGPPDDSADVNLIRIVADTVLDTPGKPLHFKITIPSAIVGALRQLAKLYFTGPASQGMDAIGNIKGFGQYCLTLYGDGLARLSELQKAADESTPHWQAVQKNIRWCEPSQVQGTPHHIEIVTEEFTAPRANRTGFILIRTADSGTAAPQGSGSLLRIAGTTNPTGVTKFYATCQDPRKWTPSIHTPVRVDQRADALPQVQLSRSVYPTTGYVCDDPIETFVFPGYSGAEFRAYFIGKIPAGTTAQVDVFRANDDVDGGTPLTALGRTTTDYGQVARYDIPPQVVNSDVQRSFRVKVSMTGDGTNTPTVERIAFIKDGAGTLYDIGETIVNHPVLDFSGAGVDYETGRETATAEFTDLFGEATQMSLRSEMPFRWDVPYPADGETEVDEDSERSIVFRGYSNVAPSEKLYKNDAQGIARFARHYSAELVGMHKRLDEAVAPLAFDIIYEAQKAGFTGNAGTYLACDIIRLILGWCGFGDDEIGWEVGDSRYPTLMFPKNGDSLLLNPGAPLGEVAMGYARNYLGRSLDYDPNSSRTAPADGEDPTGMWEMVDPPSIPYKPLARFETAPVPGGAGLFFGHVPWPDWDSSGTPVPVRAILRGESKRPESPEFNWLMVVGVGDTSGSYDPVALTSTAFNPKSLNAIASSPTQDPESVSFIGRPKRALYVDSQLSTPDAVQFVGRRLLDYAGTGRILRPFLAPFVLISDPDSPYLRRKRKLRPNDCIVVRGKWCVVRSAAVIAKKDGYQMYRIEAQELADDPETPLT